MEIKVYTTQGCFYCQKVKELLERANLKYDLINVVPNKVDIDSTDYINKTKFASLYPTINGFPFVVIDEEPIGALVPTARFLLAKGLVSANKG